MDETVAIFRRKRRILQLSTWSMRAILAEAFLVALWPTGATVALAVGTILWLARWRLDPGFHFRQLPFDVPALLFVLLGAASVCVSPDPMFSIYNYCNLVGAYAFTYLLIGQNIRTRAQVQDLALALAAGAFCVVLYGFYQYLFGIDTTDMKWVDGDAFPHLRNRIFSTWENPNILAGYLDAAICVALGVFDRAESRMQRTALGAAMAVMALCLAMTYARGACLAIALILFGYGLLKSRKFLLACVAVAVALAIWDPMFYERLASIAGQADSSTQLRFAIWESTVAMIEDHPFLGIGWGAFWMVYPQYDFFLQGADVKLVHAHNIYLNYIKF